MKKILFFLLAVTFGFVAQAQNKAEIKFVTEEIDYGTIKQGADGLRVFEFKNTGKALIITVGWAYRMQYEACSKFSQLPFSPTISRPDTISSI